MTARPLYAAHFTTASHAALCAELAHLRGTLRETLRHVQAAAIRTADADAVAALRLIEGALIETVLQETPDAP